MSYRQRPVSGSHERPLAFAYCASCLQVKLVGSGYRESYYRRTLPVHIGTILFNRPQCVVAMRPGGWIPIVVPILMGSPKTLKPTTLKPSNPISNPINPKALNPSTLETLNSLFPESCRLPNNLLAPAPVGCAVS